METCRAACLLCQLQIHSKHCALQISVGPLNREISPHTFCCASGVGRTCKCHQAGTNHVRGSQLEKRHYFGKSCLEILSATPPVLAKHRGQACESTLPALDLMNFLGHPTVWSTCHMAAPATKGAARLLDLYVGDLGQSSGGSWIGSGEPGIRKPRAEWKAKSWCLVQQCLPPCCLSHLGRK